MHFEREAFILNSRICPQLAEGKTVLRRNGTQSARKLGLPALKLRLAMTSTAVRATGRHRKPKTRVLAGPALAGTHRAWTCRL